MSKPKLPKNLRGLPKGTRIGNLANLKGYAHRPKNPGKLKAEKLAPMAKVGGDPRRYKSEKAARAGMLSNRKDI